MFLTRTRDSRTVLARNKRISGLAGQPLGKIKAGKVDSLIKSGSLSSQDCELTQL